MSMLLQWRSVKNKNYMDNDNVQKKSVGEQLLDGLLMGFGIVLPGIMAFFSLFVAPAGSIFFGAITLVAILIMLAKDAKKKRIFLGIIIIPILYFLARIFIF